MSSTTDLIERLRAREKHAAIIGGCNTVPVPMFLFQQVITELSPVMPDEVATMCQLMVDFGHKDAADLLERLAREKVKLKRRPSVAAHNALTEECDGRMKAIKKLESQRDQLAEALRKGIGALLALSYGHRYAAKKHKKLDAEFKRIMDKT